MHKVYPKMLQASIENEKKELNTTTTIMMG